MTITVRLAFLPPELVLLNTDKNLYEDINNGEPFIEFWRYKKSKAELLLDKEIRNLLTEKFTNHNYLENWTTLIKHRMAKGSHPDRNNNFIKMIRVQNPAEENL